jgi:hypothetical protein
MRPQVRTAEKEIAWIARRAHGVVARGELVAAGLTVHEIRRRVEKGLLIPEFRGVYRVGHAAPSHKAHYMAAVKACGDGTLLCGGSAAYLQSLLRKCPKPPPPEVWCTTERRVPGVRTRRSRTLSRHDRILWDGIPCTVPARTLVDVAAALDEDELMRLVHEAQVRYRTAPDQVEAVLARIPNAAGARRLRRVLHGDVHITLSALERAFLELLIEDDLPLPATNEVVDGRYVDCRWPGITVELESYRFHASRHAFEQAFVRACEARERGDDFRRYSWGDVFERRERTRRELREMLGGPR